MNSNYIFIFLIFLLSTNNLSGQYIEPKKLDVNFDFDVIIEMADLLTDKTTIKHSSDGDRITGFFAQVYPLTVYLSPKLYFGKDVCFEFRPGFFAGGDAFMGFEYGLYVRYLFYKENLFAVLGVNFHNNMGTAHNSGYSTGQTIMEYSVQFGYAVNSSFGLMLSYYLPDHEIDFYGRRTDEGDWESYILKHIFKFGFEFSF